MKNNQFTYKEQLLVSATVAAAAAAAVVVVVVVVVAAAAAVVVSSSSSILSYLHTLVYMYNVTVYYQHCSPSAFVFFFKL